MVMHRPDARRVQAALSLVAAQDQVIASLRAKLLEVESSDEAPPSGPDEAPPPPSGPVLYHILNPMPGGHVDQDVTFASLVRAHRDAQRRGLDVRLYTAEMEFEQGPPRPAVLRPGPNLTRHAHALYEMGKRHIPLRTLPLIADILEAGYRVSGTDDCADANDAILVYTNADIGVQEDFYSTIFAYAQASAAFVVNRVEIPDKDANGRAFGVDDLDELYRLGQTKPQLHPGYDCFVWRRPATPFLRLYTRGLFVGYPPVGKVLKDALACTSGGRFREIKGKHHTFHLGERNGAWQQFPQYEHYNRKAYRSTVRDFATFLQGKQQGCKAAMASLASPNDPDAIATRCHVAAELNSHPFVRWDQPIAGATSDWPPIEAPIRPAHHYRRNRNLTAS